MKIRTTLIAAVKTLNNAESLRPAKSERQEVRQSEQSQEAVRQSQQTEHLEARRRKRRVEPVEQDLARKDEDRDGECHEDEHEKSACANVEPTQLLLLATNMQVGGQRYRDRGESLNACIQVRRDVRRDDVVGDDRGVRQRSENELVQLEKNSPGEVQKRTSTR